VAAEVPSEAVVRVSLDRVQADGWDFVLEAMAIPHRVLPTNTGFALLVPPQMVATAIVALDAHDREATEEPPREAAPPDHGPSFVGMAMAITIIAFFVVTGSRAGPDAQGWFRQGSATADAIVHQHELWRAVTALTLHADAMHVAGNSLASLVFVSALGRWLGGGLALLATLLAGFAGNLLTAFIYSTSHNVVGASTATFGALGVLGGLQFVRRFHVRSVGRVRRAMLGVAAALGLFAMLGMGERSDVVAHAGGLGFGILFGVLLGQFVERPVRAPAQALALLATVATLTGAWMLAFRHP
jgi:membrane associated rhomboid family serine protease